MYSVFFIFEIIGTVAFSVSGAIIAIKKDMDIFGVIILGVTTAVGGGIVRDLMLGLTPPSIVNNDIFIIVAVFSSLLVCMPFYQKLNGKNKRIGDIILLISDSLGLAIFTVSGIKIALDNNIINAMFLTFTGVVSGVGGGVIRDIFCGEIPLVFSKHFYACASMVGAFFCILFWDIFGLTFSMIFGTIVILVLRFLAVRYHWELPKPKQFFEKRNCK